jgi:hypothetical protein
MLTISSNSYFLVSRTLAEARFDAHLCAQLTCRQYVLLLITDKYVCVYIPANMLLLQVLAIASNEKRDAMKLLHVPSGTIFSNWPTERTPIRYPYSLDFSPNGSFLAVGNDRGRVLLYRYVTLVCVCG